ncbi:cleavage and polyadenylation specificity factor subunit 2-like [Silene latifolia]|uniref:cleavage and polyadenylation specificity factor subunit 2-like n=1 Tax=Silene latifolia TaxID=37657 RepID=UPI003D77E641
MTPDSDAYEVQLSEELMSNVSFKKHGKYEVAWVDVEVGKTEGDMPLLLPLSSKPPPHPSVFIGDYKMADFKHFLASKGVQAEFSDGALRCGEIISFRDVGDPTQKGGVSGSGQIVVKGLPTDDYYTYRNFLYSQQYTTASSSFLGNGL